MISVIFRTIAFFLLIIMWSFSLWILFRGHQLPGGGFIGGLVASAGGALYILAFNSKAYKKILPVKPLRLLVFGQICILISAIIGMLKQNDFFSALWFDVIVMWVGTPLLFDVGIYLIIFSTLSVIFIILEDTA